jgi:hypothetical protein
MLKYDPLHPPKGDFGPVQVWENATKERLTSRFWRDWEESCFTK